MIRCQRYGKEHGNNARDRHGQQECENSRRDGPTALRFPTGKRNGSNQHQQQCHHQVDDDEGNHHQRQQPNELAPLAAQQTKTLTE